MKLVLSLKNNKIILVDTNDYEIGNDILRYKDTAGEHFISFAMIKELGFGKERYERRKTVSL